MWPNGKKWVYSISYDEGCELLLKNVLPIHRELNIPGHISVVAKEVGKKKESPHSSFYGMKILNRDQILSLREEGWGISCHSMTHTRITEKNAKEEVIKSKLLLEKLLGIDINIFCVPEELISCNKYVFRLICKYLYQPVLQWICLWKIIDNKLFEFLGIKS